MTDLLIRGNYVRANWGRWVADCPSPFCLSAMQVWAGQRSTACMDCESPIPELIWPADPEAIEVLLSMRPDETTRNWLPGETLSDLLMENGAHGILPRALDWNMPTLLVTCDDMIIGGAVGLQLRSDSRRHEIEEGQWPGRRP